MKQLITVCAGVNKGGRIIPCGRWRIGVDGRWHDRIEPLPDNAFPVSHGLCPYCFDATMEELTDERAAGD